MRKGKWKNAILLMLCGGLLAMHNPPTAQAAIWTVCSDGCDYTTIADAISGASPQDTLDLQAETFHESGLAVNKALTIRGQGATNTIVDAENVDRVFQVSADIDVTIQDLTIRNGNATNSYGGGGILQYRDPSSGTITVLRCAISGNESTIGGGGIFSLGGNLVVTQSTVSGNSCTGNGGAIYTENVNVAITNSTITGNSAGSQAGGVLIGNGSATIINSTLAGNSATAAAANLRSYGSTMHLTNSLLADAAGGLPDCSTALATNDNNLIEDGSCSPAVTGDPMLGTLQDNGGPTYTMALQEGSRAIGRGDDGSAPTVDQRGESRVGTADIGAFEYQGIYPEYTPDRIGADNYADIDGQTFDINDGGTDLADLEITSGSGAGSLTVERFETGCEPSSVGFCWDADVTGSFTGNLTFYYGGLNLNGLAEADQKLYHWNGSSWDEMGGTIDTETDTITVNGVTEADFSTFTLNSSSPLLIELSVFTATYGKNGVHLFWETASEIDNAGFHLWRSESKNGEYTRITETLIPAMGNEITGTAYSYTDTSASNTEYYYKLEDIDYDGKSAIHICNARYLNLEPGWNVLNGSTFAGLSPETALASVGAKYTNVWGFVGNSWKMHDPEQPELGDLGIFEAGNEYWIYMDEAGTMALP